ncbi:hypothetical protein BC628DRAFT_421895 [Trametes gibbosa]|nr:hypothetical protein BC628DRAFT_421895 [Trametes gibbosa]
MTTHAAMHFRKLLLLALSGAAVSRIVHTAHATPRAAQADAEGTFDPARTSGDFHAVLAANPARVPVRAGAYTFADAQALTNAQRFARGLPPRKPMRRYGGGAPVRDAVRAAGPRPGEGPRVGGYTLARVGDTTVDVLSVVLRWGCASAGDENVPFEIEAENGLEGLPMFGGVVGVASSDDSLSKDSHNYVFLSGTDSVRAGAAENAGNGFTAATGFAADVESAVWTASAPAAADGTRALAMGWVNPDGGAARGPQLVYVAQEDAFALVGDAGVFRQAFGPAPSVVSRLWLVGADEKGVADWERVRCRRSRSCPRAACDRGRIFWTRWVIYTVSSGMSYSMRACSRNSMDGHSALRYMIKAPPNSNSLCTPKRSGDLTSDVCQTISLTASSPSLSYDIACHT